MDLLRSHLFIHESSAPSTSISSAHSSYSITNFPILAIAVTGILATAFLLVSYYIIVIKCCLNLHRVSLTQDSEISTHSPARMQQPKGLDQAAINFIPIIEFNKAAEREASFQECSVCLGEFKVNEKLRCLQDCTHLFHIDCIDVWLQNNANCPLCRTSISYTNPSTTRHDLATATRVDSNFVVIEIQQQQQQQQQQQEANYERDTPKKTTRRMRQHQQVLSMGDEWIDVRVKDDAFKIQPVRRSISMDSSDDRQHYLMVQAVLLHHQKMSTTNVSDLQACSSSGNNSSRFKRAFFSFGSARGCKGSSSSLVLPTHV